MRLRCVAAVLMICGAALTAGCPSGPGLDFGLGSSYFAIQDGSYAGNVTGFVEVWQWDELYLQDSGGDESAGTFWNGAVVKDSGYELQIGDVEDMNQGTFAATREVTDIQMSEGIYQVSYEVFAEWDTIPMYGTQLITFTGNADGSVELIDTLELYSLVDVDGGEWSFFAETSGTLLPAQGPVEPPPHDILDVKSGKIVIDDSTTR